MYMCHEGYSLTVENSSRVCGESDKWSGGYTPQCVSVSQIVPTTTDTTNRIQTTGNHS